MKLLNYHETPRMFLFTGLFWCLKIYFFRNNLIYFVYKNAMPWRAIFSMHDDVIKWKHFPRYWPFGNSPVIGDFPAQRPVTRSFDVFFDLRLNKRLSKQWRGWWRNSSMKNNNKNIHIYFIRETKEYVVEENYTVVKEMILVLRLK